MNELREKIARYMSEGGNYGFERDEWWLHEADAILFLVREEIGKVKNPNQPLSITLAELAAFHAFEQCRQKILALITSSGEEIIEDGFGNAWSAYCPKCGQKTLSVVRPGKVQCSKCG